jgi:hypothetical protein
MGSASVVVGWPSEKVFEFSVSAESVVTADAKSM